MCRIYWIFYINLINHLSTKREKKRDKKQQNKTKQKQKGRKTKQNIIKFY